MKYEIQNKKINYVVARNYLFGMPSRLVVDIVTTHQATNFDSTRHDGVGSCREYELPRRSVCDKQGQLSLDTDPYTSLTTQQGNNKRQ